MTIQQMMLGGYSPIQVSAAPADGSVFEPEPAPLTWDVHAGTTASAVGGTNGPYTYSWTYVSGDSGISPTTATTNASCGWSATVNKNSQRNAVWRCTVSDGITSSSTDVTVSLSYYTDL